MCVCVWVGVCGWVCVCVAHIRTLGIELKYKAFFWLAGSKGGGKFAGAVFALHLSTCQLSP